MADYLAYSTVVQYAIILVLQLFSFYFFGSILYWSTFRKFTFGMNLSMMGYIFLEFIFALDSSAFAAYMILYWRPDENIYNAWWMFFTGGSTSLLLVTQPLISCFLGIDRCLCLLLPFKNTKFWNRIVVLLTLGFVGIFWGLYLPLYTLDAIPVRAETNCRSFSCLLKTSTGQIYTVLRYITSVSSVIIGVILIRLFNSKVTKQYHFKTTRLVVITLVMTILFDFIPHLISFCFATFAGINLTKLIGPYSTVCSSINSFVCGLYYYKTMRKSMKSKAIEISTATHQVRGTITLNNSKIVSISR